MISRIRRNRMLGLVVPALALSLAVIVLYGGTGSDARAAAAEVGGELQIDQLSLATPIAHSNLSVTNTATSGAGGGAGAGKATFGPVVLQKTVDANSPTLMNAVATGIHLESVIVRVFKPGTTRTVVTYTLSDVTLVGLDQADNVETLSLSYRQIEMAAGGESACFDVSGNVTC